MCEGQLNIDEIVKFQECLGHKQSKQNKATKSHETRLMGVGDAEGATA
jgi:hypothetical protein